MSENSINATPKRGAHAKSDAAVAKPAKKRDATFDIAKGIAIYLVVLGHIFAIGEIDAMSPFYNFINYTHMPVFFFISGWFFARYFRSCDGGEGKRFRQKAARLLVPFLLCPRKAYSAGFRQRARAECVCKYACVKIPRVPGQIDPH